MRGAEACTFKIVGWPSDPSAQLAPVCRLRVLAKRDSSLAKGWHVIEPRIYRAAFVPALLALVLAAFSLESRPAPLPQGLLADVLFDGNLAAQAAAQIADRRPNRRPGSPGDLGMANDVAGQLGRRGFSVQR